MLSVLYAVFSMTLKGPTVPVKRLRYWGTERLKNFSVIIQATVEVIGCET